MKSHFRFVSKAPCCAQSNFQTKLQGILDIMDLLLLAQRQSAWKAFFPVGGATGEPAPDGGGGVGGIGGGGDDGGPF